MKVFDTPHFATEEEEADWWDTHQDEVAVAFEEAARNGTLGRGTLAREGMRAFDILTSGESLPQEQQVKLSPEQQHKDAA